MREREINLLRKRKRFNKKYSDFELGLLVSEINDYTYLLKSIQFPIEKYKISDSKNEKEDEEKKRDNDFKKNIQLEEAKEEKEEKEEKLEDNSEEYNGLKAKGLKNKNKKKRK